MIINAKCCMRLSFIVVDSEEPVIDFVNIYIHKIAMIINIFSKLLLKDKMTEWLCYSQTADWLWRLLKLFWKWWIDFSFHGWCCVELCCRGLMAAVYGWILFCRREFSHVKPGQQSFKFFKTLVLCTQKLPAYGRKPRS